MGIISPTSIDPGGARGTEEIDVKSNITALLSLVNGALDDANIAAGANISGSKLLTGSIPVTKLQNFAFGTFVPGTGMGGLNRAFYSIPHGLGSTPSWWMGFGGLILGASTSTGQNEVVTVGRFSQDATNLVAMVSLTNGATAAVGPSGITWVAIV